MRNLTLMMSAAALFVAAPDASAQAKNFAGKWTVVVDPNAPPPTGGRGGRGGLGQEPTIAQDDKTLTITRTTQMGEVKSVYNLDGSESKNTMTFGGNAVEQVSKTKWDGDKLVITTTSNFGGNTIESSMVLSIDASGNLVVQSTSPGRGGGAPTTTTMTYKKG
jgi:hypothetical protein